MAGTTRQTLSYLRNLFEERGIKPKSKLGQNFLIDLNLLDVLLRAAELSRDDLALEVGSGTGGLTVRLLELAGAVLSVEIDPAYSTLVEEAVADFFLVPAGLEGSLGVVAGSARQEPRPPNSAGASPSPAPPVTTVAALPRPRPTEGPAPFGGPIRPEHVRLIHADVLARKNELAPEVMSGLAELASQAGTRNLKVVANLPYAVAVPVISNLLLSDVAVERMVVTVQWEIAERLTAAVGCKDYNSLAVLVQSLAEVQILRRLPPAAFWPRPQVDSAFVLVRPDAGRRAEVLAAVGSVQRFRNFLRDLYVHRRKNLRGGLVALPGVRREKAEIDARLAELGIDGTARAETLSVADHLRLCSVFG